MISFVTELTFVGSEHIGNNKKHYAHLVIGNLRNFRLSKDSIVGLTRIAWAAIVVFAHRLYQGLLFGFDIVGSRIYINLSIESMDIKIKTMKGISYSASLGYVQLCVFLWLLLIASSASLYAQSANQFTTTQHLEDFEFALEELENSYAGFDTYVNDATREEYDSIVSSLRRQIKAGNRSGYDAALYLYSWFDDGHLGLDMGSYKETGKYMSDRRKYQPYEMIQPYLPEPTATAVTSRTYLIRLPEFDEETVSSEWIANAINNFNTSDCENLIIDVRGNGGGDERIWHTLLPLLYDHPGTTKSVEFRMSDNNIAFLKELEDEFPEAKMILDKYNQAHEPYILLTDNEDIEIVVPEYNGKKPLKVGFIIDANNGSATEELLIQAKAISDRAIIYGKENTGGCLDCSSLRESNLPNSRYPIFIPIARSCRLPENGIDKTGIAPDVIIPIDYPTSLTNNLDEWVLWIAEKLVE